MIRYATISLWLSCLVLALSCIGMTERALAQVECPGASGDDGNSTQVTWIRATGGSCASGLASQSDYNDPSTTSSNYTFMLFLPGDAPVAGGANNVKFMARNASGTPLNITDIYCYRYNLGFVNYRTEAPTTGIGSTIGTVELDDGDECDLKIQFGEISYVGRILSRVGDTYSIRGGSLVGGDFGITAPTETGQAGTFERNGKLLVSLYQEPLPSRVVINSDTDEVERQTVGQPFTLRYTITNIGTEQLASCEASIGCYR